MDDYPISISEAARRLRIPFQAASILVRSLEIPTVKIRRRYGAKGIDRAGFLLLKSKSAAFRRDPDLETAGAGNVGP